MSVITIKAGTDPVFSKEEYQSDSRVIDAAASCSFVTGTDMAFVTHIRKMYPMPAGSAEEESFDSRVQNSFDALMFFLFYRIREGHVCLRADSVNHIFQLFREWKYRSRSESSDPNDPQAVSADAKFLSEVAEFIPKDNESLHRLISLSPAIGTAEGNTPLVYEYDRIYVRRYYNYEKQTGEFIRTGRYRSFKGKEEDLYRRALSVMFTDEDGLLLPDRTDRQKIAAAMAGISDFCVISGGPGTGKTTTVFKILILQLCANPDLKNLILCAPTAKAASRMTESILKQKNSPAMQEKIRRVAEIYGTDFKDLTERIPVKAQTVHSILRIAPHKPKPAFDSKKRLNCDMIIIDEVSMLDLTLCSKLLTALPVGCRVIMLGDKDQLSSVGEGKILGDICSVLDRQSSDTLSSEVLDFISSVTGYDREQILRCRIADRTVLLEYSWRSKDRPAIGELAKAVNDTDTSLRESQLADLSADTLLHETDEDKLFSRRFFAYIRQRSALIQTVFEKERIRAEEKREAPAIILRMPESSLFNDEKRLTELFNFRRELADNWTDPAEFNSFGPFLQALKDNDFRVSTDGKDSEELFALMDRFRVLCSNHNGIFGDRLLNTAIEQAVLDKYVNCNSTGDYAGFRAGSLFPGRLILITENNPSLGLYNGTVGFCAYPEEKGKDHFPKFKIRRIRSVNGNEFTDERLRVFLPADDRKNKDDNAAVNTVSSMFLNRYESGFAMSVHKSQGSEYRKVALIMSDRKNPTMSKELVYTGITRAKEQVELVSSKESLMFAVSRAVSRESGLSLRMRDDTHPMHS